jgi:hypothetical protein
MQGVYELGERVALEQEMGVKVATLQSSSSQQVGNQEGIGTVMDITRMPASQNSYIDPPS